MLGCQSALLFSALADSDWLFLLWKMRKREKKKKRLFYVIHSIRGQTITSYLFFHFAIDWWNFCRLVPVYRLVVRKALWIFLLIWRGRQEDILMELSITKWSELRTLQSNFKFESWLSLWPWANYLISRTSETRGTPSWAWAQLSIHRFVELNKWLFFRSLSFEGGVLHSKT